MWTVEVGERAVEFAWSRNVGRSWCFVVEVTGVGARETALDERRKLC